MKKRNRKKEKVISDISDKKHDNSLDINLSNELVELKDDTDINDVSVEVDEKYVDINNTEKNNDEDELIVFPKKRMNNKKNVFLVIVISLVLGLVSFIYFLFFKSTISFKYDNSIYNVDVLSDFSIPEVIACYGNRIKCKNIDVSIDNSVDTSKVGEYKVIYSARHNKKSKDLVINVNVIDREVPIIDVANESLSVCPNATEFNIDYKAYDNYDGDLTSSVIQNVVDDVLILSVNDSSNNVGSKDIHLIREDLEGPIISINGNSTMYLPVGSNYNESGASAVDNCDGDVSSNISISGKVDTSKSGTNSITYTVSDSSGNSSSVTRNVYVYASNGNGSKVVYLTFDDGPSAYTGELLDILARYNVKATFFVTNRNPNYNHFIKRAYDEGHTIALHTSSHNYGLVYSSVDAYFNDLNAINETVKNITGSYSYLLRFPGGSSNTVSRNYSSGIMSTLSQMVTERGYKYFDWNVSSSDADGRNHPSSDYSNNIINGISGKSMSIVLQHDTNINSIRSVSAVIEYGLAHGYTFLPLDMSSPVVHHKINN